MLKNMPPKTPNHPLKARVGGFTLSELLISLAILGVIATFSIPKILSAQQSQADIAKTKEVVGMISGAYQQAKLAGIINANSKPVDLLPYFNYTQFINDGSLTIDGPANYGASANCSASYPCIKLHNGGVLLFSIEYFNGSSSLNTVQFLFDPTGKQEITTTADGPGKTIQFELYYDGFITTRGQAKAGSCHSGTCGFGPNATLDPSWMQW